MTNEKEIFCGKGGIAFLSEKDYWETPQNLFDKLDSEFHFTLDPASTDDNAKCTKHFTIRDDGLTQAWGGERVFCNSLEPSPLALIRPRAPTEDRT